MKRSPAAAFWLSLLPGLGHLYLGQINKGLAFALVTVALIEVADRGPEAFPLFIIAYWVFVMLDAHRSAQAINLEAETGDILQLSGSKWWGGALIALGVLFLLQNFDLFEFDWIWQFWPVVLIVVGIRLIKPPPAVKMAPPPSPTVPPAAAPADEARSMGETESGGEMEAEPDATQPSAEEGETDDRNAAG